jgi:hypothetical protein
LFFSCHQRNNHFRRLQSLEEKRIENAHNAIALRAKNGHYEKVEEAKEQNDVIEILSSDSEEGSIGIVDNEQKSSRARNS